MSKSLKAADILEELVNAERNALDAHVVEQLECVIGMLREEGKNKSWDQSLILIASLLRSIPEIVELLSMLPYNS